jgi:hypothetical protein
MGKSYQGGYLTPRGKKWYEYFRRTVVDPTTHQTKSVRVALILGQKSDVEIGSSGDAPT